MEEVYIASAGDCYYARLTGRWYHSKGTLYLEIVTRPFIFREFKFMSEDCIREIQGEIVL